MNNKFLFHILGFGVLITLIFTVFSLVKLIYPYIIPFQQGTGEILIIFLDVILQIVIINILHIISLTISNSFYIFLYYNEFILVEQYKIEQKQWPWKSRKNWNQIVVRVIKQYLINMIVGIIFQYIVSSYVKAPFKVEGFPQFTEVLKQLFLGSFVEDTIFYWSHRLLHTKHFYKRIHKVHHEFDITGKKIYHSIIKKVSFASEYAHPIEYILGNVIPVTTPPYLVFGSSMHFVTYYVWVFVGIIKAVSDHCGYRFPWSPFAITTPGRTYAEFHSFHHSQNIGNFASIYPINDYLWGTSKEYYKYYKLE